jgi:SNF2 family DNA or RNA helicase
MSTISLRPYQKDAVEALLATPRAMVLAPVGAGKTAITLTAIARKGGRFLVVAPLRVATSVWPAEAPKWAPGLKVAVACGTPAQRLAALRDDSADIVVTNFDNLQWLSAQQLDFDAIVFDELTRLKNPSGLRFKALMRVLDQFPVRWGLTGSFTSNGLEDVFGQCKVIDTSLLGRSKGAFMQVYFHEKKFDNYSEWTPRKGALAAVMQCIKPATYLLSPGEYTDTLPPLHTVPIHVEMEMREYEIMRKNFALEFDDRQAIAMSAAVVVNKLAQLASGFVYDEAREPIFLSSHKFDALDELLEENQHAPTIVVYQFKAELEELQRRYPHARGIDAMDDWNAGRVPLLLLHPKSAGHGLNLQHGGSHIVFFSLPWSLELYEQTIGRLHRSGQRHDVWCYLLLTRGTVDERIHQALKDKLTLSEVAIHELANADASDRVTQ